MKTLMLGNEAAARGLYEAGCSFVSSYPGTPSTEITECAAKYPEIYAEWAPNEKVAMEAAFGASLAGYRSFCGMKHVGLNVAADPLFTLSYTGVRGGLVIGVSRVAAAEFTFFLAVPVMVGVSLLKIIAFGFSFTSAELITLIIGCVVAFLVSIVVIKFLMSYIKRKDFKVFGWYRIVLGVVVIAYFLLK